MPRVRLQNNLHTPAQVPLENVNWMLYKFHTELLIKKCSCGCMFVTAKLIFQKLNGCCKTIKTRLLIFELCKIVKTRLLIFELFELYKNVVELLFWVKIVCTLFTDAIVWIVHVNNIYIFIEEIFLRCNLNLFWNGTVKCINIVALNDGLEQHCGSVVVFTFACLNVFAQCENKICKEWPANFSVMMKF